MIKLLWIIKENYQTYLAGIAGFEPTILESKSSALTSWLHPIMEQIVRIELTTNAWQAPILPLNYICIGTCDKT